MRSSIFFVALLVVPACADPLEFADWTIEVPDGIPIHQYAGVPMTERTQRIEFVEDLVLAPTDPEIAFYSPFSMDVDDDDRIYVLDGGLMHIAVFDSQGTFIRKLGKRGQGPGELSNPTAMYVFGDRLVLGDSSLNRMSVWDLAGNLLDDIPYGTLPHEPPDQPASDNAYVTFRVVDREPDQSGMNLALERYSLDLELEAQYMTFRTGWNLTIGDDFHPHDPTARNAFAAEKNGPIYFTRGDRVQVLAFEHDAVPRWALRTTWPAPRFDDEAKRRTMAAYYNPEGITVNSPGWPEYMAAVQRLVVDSAGRLWVYLRDRYETSIGGETAVDIYDRDGNRLCACLAPNIYWQKGRRDYVLANNSDPETGEWRVVRYRVVMPF